METVTSADGTLIASRRSGEGPPLLLLHGTGRDGSYWRASLPALSRKAAVLAVDRRGRGGSGDSNAYDMEREIEDVLAVIQASDEPVFLLGHSYGAILALEAALRAPDLRGLMLYEPPFSVGPDRVPTDLGDRLADLMTTGDREAVLVTFLENGPRFPPEVITAQRAQPDWQYRLRYAHTLPREVQAVNRYLYTPGRVASLSGPCLLMLGSESPPFFRQAIEALHREIPRSDVVIFEGQHHNAMVTAPALFAETVLSFMQQHRSDDA